MRCIQTALLICCFFFGASSPAYARDHALIVAAGKYDDTSVRNLKGPVNDAAGLFSALRLRGVAAGDIVVLADGPSAVTALNTPEYTAAIRGRATRANIETALKDLADRATSGDAAVIYFSGHGVQVPDLGEPDGSREPDGLDEAIAPVDVQVRGDIVDNVITDDQFGEAVAKVRAKGAFVWVILDSCHSGTGLRGGSDEPSSTAVARLLKPAPASAAPRESFSDPAERSDEGFSALYAVHPDERAYEDNFTDGGAPVVWGAMTHAILPLLRGSGPVNVRTLAAAARAAYDWREPRTPYVEGAIDRPFLKGGAKRTFLARSASGEWRLDAGALDGVGQDWRFALADPAKPGVILAEAHVRSTTATGAVIDVAARTAGAPLPALLTADPASRPPAPPLRVRVGGNARLQALARTPLGDGSPISFVAQAPFDAALAVEGKDVLITRTGLRDGGYAPGLSMDALAKPDGAAVLARALRAYGAAQSLTRALQTFEALPKDAPLAISVAVRRAKSPPAATTRCPTPPQGQPWKTEIDNAWSQATPVDPEREAVKLSHCDMMLVRLTNQTAKSVDVTALYIEGSAAISSIFVDPGNMGSRSARLTPKQTATFGFYEDFASDNTASRQYAAVTGAKQLSIIMAEAVDGSAKVSFDYLTQSRIETLSPPPTAPSVQRSDTLPAFDRIVRATMAVQPDGPLRGIDVRANTPQGDARVVTVRFQSFLR